MQWPIEIFDGKFLTNKIATSYSSRNIDNALTSQIPINMFISASSYQDVTSIVEDDIDDLRVTSFADSSVVMCWI